MIGSPLVSTRLATGSGVACRGARPPPISSSTGGAADAVSGITDDPPDAVPGRPAWHPAFPADRDRQRDRNGAIGDVALDLALDIVRQLAAPNLVKKAPSPLRRRRVCPS